jgi:UDP-N-acetylmuramoyl-tripeptide--D-alanyl-D-alanine ligase
VYIPIIGENLNGHDFIDGAIKNGATVIYYSPEYYESSKIKKHISRNSKLKFIESDDTTLELGAIAKKHLQNLRNSNKDLKVVAITGSVGKTSTKDVLGQLLAEVSKNTTKGSSETVIFPAESFNNEIGVPLTILRATKNTKYLVLEIGANHLGEIAYLTDLVEPDVAILLKAGVAHIGGFGDESNILDEKVQIFNTCPKYGIIQADDDNSHEIATKSRKISPKTKFIELTKNNITISSTSVTPLSFEVKEKTRTESISTNFFGNHHIYNILAAILTTQILTGASISDISKIVRDIRPIAKHRMTLINLPKNVSIIDDSYNANPDSMKAALDELHKQAVAKEVKAVAILGEMLELGTKTLELHDEVVKYALEVADIDVLVIADADFNGTSDETKAISSYNINYCEQLAKNGQKIYRLKNYKFETSDVLYLLKASSASKLWELVDEIEEAI